MGRTSPAIARLWSNRTKSQLFRSARAPRLACGRSLCPRPVCFYLADVVNQESVHETRADAETSSLAEASMRTGVNERVRGGRGWAEQRCRKGVREPSIL